MLYEVITRVRRRLLRIQPHGATFGLTELGSVRLGDQRQRQRMHRRAIHPAHQLHTTGNIAPLIGAADLQRTAVSYNFV